MNNRIPPSKPVLAAALIPIPVAVGCALGFGYFGISLGVILSIVGLAVYYVIFGIVIVVKNYKHDTAQKAIDKAASPALKIATVFLIIITVGLIGGAFAAFAFEEKVIALACIGAWVAVILLFVVVLGLSSRVRKTPPKSANRRGEGVCELCVPAFGFTYMSGVGRNGLTYKNKSSYKIIVNLDGRRLTAYSYNCYSKGDRLQIAFSDNSKKCYIV